MSAHSHPVELCIVVPVHNEADVLPDTLPTILRTAADAAPGVRIRMVAVDDGSTDATATVLERLAETHPAIEPIGFTRNFGKEAAIHAGLCHALAATEADVFVVIDADLQHPPALIGEMLDRWRAGYDVVEASKRDRGAEPPLRRWAALHFYRAFSRLSGVALEGDTDFKLLDRRVVEEVVQLGERTRFFRGIVRWLGHPTAQIVFDVAPRAGGVSGWSLLGLARYAWRNLTAYSSAPLGLVTAFGAVGLGFGVLLAAKAVFDKLAGKALTGFSTVILLQILFGSLILLSLGIIGSYIARIYDELKRRPLYVLRAGPREAAGTGGAIRPRDEAWPKGAEGAAGTAELRSGRPPGASQ